MDCVLVDDSIIMRAQHVTRITKLMIKRRIRTHLKNMNEMQCAVAVKE